MEELSSGYALIEGPVWVAGRGLLFSDVTFGGVYCLDLTDRVSEVFPHRKGIGGMAEHADGGMVVSGRNISYKSFAGGDTVMLLDRNERAGLVGFNDITADNEGRIYAGGLGNSPVFYDGRSASSENLYLIELDGKASVVAEDVRLTNGLGFSPDGKLLYHSDSLRSAVCCYVVHGDGSLGAKEIFVTTERGAPDGLVVAQDGSVWVALAGGSAVGVYEPGGQLRAYIDVPHPMCTSVCFGGSDLQDLYIVTGSDGLEGDKRGGVFRLRTEVAGLPVPKARVRLP